MDTLQAKLLSMIYFRSCWSISTTSQMLLVNSMAIYTTITETHAKQIFSAEQSEVLWDCEAYSILICIIGIFMHATA